MILNKKCETCEKLNNLKQRVHDLSGQIRVMENNNTELQNEINFYRMNSIPISLDEKFALWELHNRRLEGQKKSEEEKHTVDIDKLIDELDD
jgi:hypothetical protein